MRRLDNTADSIDMNLSKLQETVEDRGACCATLHACTLRCSSYVRLFATLCTVAHKVPLSMGFSRQEYWNECHALLQGIFPTQESNLCLLCLLRWQASSSPLTPPGKPLCTLPLSAAKLCLAPFNSMDCSMPVFPVPHCLLEFAQIHVY